MKNISFFDRYKLVFTSSILLVNQCLMAIEYIPLKIDEKHLSVITQKSHQAESVVVSGDESQICWNGSPTDSKLPPREIYVKQLGISSPEQMLKKKKTNFLSFFTKCSFDPQNKLVTDELEYHPGAILWTTAGYIFTKDWEPKGYHSTVSIYNQGKKEQEYDSHHFGIDSSVVIEHPRVSPNGQFLSFYLENNENKGGLFIFDRLNGITQNLGSFADKHPTFSPDGERLLFHNQIMVGKEERSQLGYYQLVSGSPHGSGLNRVLMTPNQSLAADYVYEKHPSEHKALQLIFFHGQETANAKKFIGVRSLEVPDLVFKLQLSFAGKKLKSAKHPSVAYTESSSLYFVGKLEEEKTIRLFKLDIQALQTIRTAFRSGRKGGGK